MKTMLVAGIIGLSLTLQGCNRNEEVAADAGAPAAEAMPNMPMPGAPAATAEHSVYMATGEITAVGADSVTIQHQPVAELNWPSMSMMFKAPDAAMITGLTPGAQVSFSFHQDGADYILTEIRRQ
jgi:Cu/Ag efflux protein CusF